MSEDMQPGRDANYRPVGMSSAWVLLRMPDGVPVEGVGVSMVDAERDAVRRREAADRFARETRLYWSGRPDPMTQQILRAFNVSAKDIGLVQRSAFSPEYRRRQRARVKRRRR